jgi:hypothetical protein
MARPLRIERPDAWYHVLSRGNGRQAVYHLDVDYDRFAELLGQMQERFRVQVRAFVFMGNHYHYHGLFFGSSQAWGRLKDRIGLTKADREKPQTRALVHQGSVDAFVADCAGPMDLAASDVAQLRRPVRGRERPLRDMLILLSWQSGRFTLTEIGHYFNVGYTSVANARSRAQSALRKNKALRSQLSKLPPNDK